MDSQPQVTTRFRNANIETALCNFSIIKPVKVMMPFMVMTTLYWHTNLLKLDKKLKRCVWLSFMTCTWRGRRTWLSKTGKSISSHFISLTTWFLWLNLTRKQRPCMSRMGFLLLKKKVECRPGVLFLVVLGFTVGVWLLNVLECKWTQEKSANVETSRYRCKTDERDQKKRPTSDLFCYTVCVDMKNTEFSHTAPW